MRLFTIALGMILAGGVSAKTSFEFDEKSVDTPLKKEEVPVVCGVVENGKKDSSEAHFYKETHQLWLRAKRHTKTKEKAKQFCAKQHPVGAWRLPAPVEVHKNATSFPIGDYWVDGKNVFDSRNKMNVYVKGGMDVGGTEKCEAKKCIAMCIASPTVEIDDDLMKMEFSKETMETRPQKIEQGKIAIEIQVKIPEEGKEKQSVVWVGPLKERVVLKSYDWIAGDTSNWRLIGFTKSGNSFWFYREDIEGATTIYSYDVSGKNSHLWKQPPFYTKIHRALEGGLHFFDPCGRRTGVLFSESVKFDGKKRKLGDELLVKVKP